jgi:hypothetical protein
VAPTGFAIGLPGEEVSEVMPRLTATIGLIAAVLLVLFAISEKPLGQSCVATAGEWNGWGESGNGIVYGEVVPDDERWLVRAASINSQEPVGAEYMLEIAHPVAMDANMCCWFVALQRGAGKPDGTPQLALDREVTLLPRERLVARANGLRAPNAMALSYLFWRLPLACPAPATYVITYTRGGSAQLELRDLMTTVH